MTLHVGLLVFPNVQQLDLTGPYEIFAMMPETQVHLVAKTMEPLLASTGLWLTPTQTFARCPQLDVICVPGGIGINALLRDDVTLAFLQGQATAARYITSVCTGALVLGAAGLLRGRRATTHWGVHDLLSAFGAIPVQGRVVRDGAFFTGGGVTAGIDFALTMAAELFGEAKARQIQLQIEYAPEPPFAGGTPETSPPAIVQNVRASIAEGRAERERIIRQCPEAHGAAF